MISKFQELHENQTKENLKLLEEVAKDYAITRTELNEKANVYDKLSLDYDREDNQTQKVILKRKLRDLEECILELNSKLEAQELEIATLRYTNIDYDIEDIKKDITKYLKSKKVDNFSKRLIEAKEQYIKSIDTIYADALSIHKDVQALKEALANNFNEEELCRHGIKSSYEKICIDGLVENIDLRFSSVDLIEDIPTSLELFNIYQSLLKSKIKDTYMMINNI